MEADSRKKYISVNHSVPNHGTLHPVTFMNPSGVKTTMNLTSWEVHDMIYSAGVTSLKIPNHQACIYLKAFQCDCFAKKVKKNKKPEG